MFTGVPWRRSPPKISARWRYRLPNSNLAAHYNSQFCESFHFGLGQEAKNKHNFINFKSLWGGVQYIAGLVSNPCMLEKDCNSNPISTFPPCYAFQVIFTALAPRLIQSLSHNVHNKNRALKRLCVGQKQIIVYLFQILCVPEVTKLTLTALTCPIFLFFCISAMVD